MNTKTALLAGASGLVGGHLLQLLLSSNEYKRVHILVRKPLGIIHEKLKETQVNFDILESYKDLLKADDVFCCLGTTIKKAGSQEAFKKVDVDYPVMLGRLAKESRAERFLIVSSMGANPESKIFYSRMKGLTEKTLEETGLKSLFIFRPSLLLGNRQEHRAGEKMASAVMKGIGFLFAGSLRKYKAIEAKTVAQAMLNAAQLPAEGVHVYLSDEIWDLAEGIGKRE